MKNKAIFTKFQVSVKQSEIGIAPMPYEFGFKLVDYLPHMYTHEFPFLSKKPVETDTYDTIIKPFDKYVWIFMFVCIFMQFLLLRVLQQLYNQVTGTKNPKNFIYEGNVQDSIYVIRNNSTSIK